MKDARISSVKRLNIRGVVRVARGFTLIEVLVVVAIIALLVAILIPSLSRARESARSAMCLSNLSQMGKAVNMYTVDHNGTLPGPLHAGIIYHNSKAWYETEKFNSPPPAQKFYSRCIFSILTRKYFSDTSKNASGVDDATACPTADKASMFKRGAQDYSSYIACTNSAGSGHYIANTSHSPVPKWTSTTVARTYPYGATAPPNYFGWADTVGDNIAQFNANSSTVKKPKKIEVVKRASDEWMIADLWYAFGTLPTTGPLQLGTWSFVNPTPSVLDPSGAPITIPEYPYHMTTKSYAGTYLQATQPNAPRITNGRTNSIYFDGHAASVARWLGTVNPQ